LRTAITALLGIKQDYH